MAGQYYIVLVVFFVFPFVYCSKMDKKSTVYARMQVDKCKDYSAVSAKCRMWKDLGFCFKHRREMQFVCSKTCKFCAPGQSHWLYSSNPDQTAETKDTVHILDEPEGPDEESSESSKLKVEILGKKTSTNAADDVTGMLESITGKNAGEEEHHEIPHPKEIAVIQGRIQKGTPLEVSKNKTNTKEQQKPNHPNITVGGKMQSLPPPMHYLSAAGKEGSKQEELTAALPEKGVMKTADKPRKANSERNNLETKAKAQNVLSSEKNIDNTLLSVMNFLVGDDSVKGNTTAKAVQGPKIYNVAKSLQEMLDDSRELASGGEHNKSQTIGSKLKTATGTKQKAESDSISGIEAGIKLLDGLTPKQNSEETGQSTRKKPVNDTGKGQKTGIKPVAGVDMLYNINLLDADSNKENKKPQVQDEKMLAFPVPIGILPKLGKITIVNVSSSNAQQDDFLLHVQDGNKGNIQPSDRAMRFVDTAASTAGEATKNAPPTGTATEQQMLNILNGLSQDDKASEKKDKKGKKGKKENILDKVREAYEELGKKIGDVEDKEGNGKSKKKKGEEKDNEEGKTKKEESNGIEEKGKHKNDGEKKNGDKKKDKNKNEDEDDDEDEEEDEDEDNDEDEEEDDDNFFDPGKVANDEADKLRAKTRHLERALMSIKKAEEHLDMAEGKRRKKKKIKEQEPMDEDADTRNGKDWKKMAKKLARQLKVVLKEVKRREAQHKMEKSKLRYMLAILARQEWARRQRGNIHNDEDRPDDGDEDDGYDEDGRSRILHNMASKLFSFDKDKKELHTHVNLAGKEVLKREKVLHSLVSRYRGLITKILANWIKIKKGKKKSKIPKKRGFGKRTEIERGKGNHTTKAAGIKSLTNVIRLPRRKVKKAGKDKKKHGKSKQVKEKSPKVQTEDDENVVEVVR